MNQWYIGDGWEPAAIEFCEADLCSWIIQPAIIALRQWMRRAEITCDRAGLLCCAGLGGAARLLA